MDTKYSLTTLLNNLLKLQNNGYQILASLSDVVSSNADTVAINTFDSTGALQQVFVPSFGSLKNQIIKLENDVKSVSGVGDANSSVQLSDGSFRKILVSSLQKEAADITSISLPTTFNKRENWFFESFLNPLLYVSFNLSNQIKYNTERFEYARYILNLDSSEKIKIFNNVFSGKSDIKYQDFVQILIDNGITYFLDKDVENLPPRTLRYSGNFSVTNIYDDTITTTENGVNVQNRVLRVQLDKLIYDDNQSRYSGTQQLKIGDSLVVNSGYKNTRYQILQIDSAIRTVSVKLIEGFDPILIGADVLSFYGEDKADVVANINIGFNEYCVIFIKPIDPDSKIESINWSPGVGVYTNNLNIIDPTTGKSTSLSTYYQNEVVDFGAYLYSSVKDKTTPASFGVTPDAPVLSTDNFKVLQVNEHLTTSGDLEKLQKLQSDKLRIQSQINTQDKSIFELRSKIQTTRYSSQKLQDTDNNQLSRIVNDRSTQSSLYASVVNDIVKISASQNVENIIPKYRVRGFFPIPEVKFADRTGTQHVVQFVIQYRYLKKNGSANQPQQIAFVDNDGKTIRGTFSNWVEQKSELRKRVIDTTTGVASWATEDIQNADTVNINQIDIAIQQGESVEFRIKSISEAGWPVTPLESEWSEIIKIDFPSEYESLPDPASIIDQAKREQVKVEFDSELTNMNLDKVSNYTISQNGKFYTTDSVHIASGFLTPENNIISLFDKLTQLDNELNNIKSLIANAKGSISVRIVDDSGQEYPVENNTTVRLFAGNYRDQVASLPVKKGVIITKNYYIKISNDAASVLELYSRMYGSKYAMINTSWSGGSDFNSSDIDYNSLRRYDFVPLGLSNPTTDDYSIYGFIRSTPQQSSQVKGQFINNRYLSVDGTRALYNQPSGSTSYGIQNSTQYLGSTYSAGIATSLSDVEWRGNLSGLSTATLGTPGTDFVWAGGSTATDVIPFTATEVSTNLYTNLLIHTDHPDIPSWIAEGVTPGVIAGTTTPKYIRNSILGNIQKGASGSNLQTAFFYEGVGGTGDLYSKIGFDTNDQYLLGPRSVGCYLFVNPSTHTDLVVNGSDSISVKSVNFGNANSISVPVTFQYRMTDYYGIGNVGLGNVGGLPTANSSTNLEYTKTLGIDIYANPLDKNRFSFDLEVTSRYYSKSLITKDIPVRSFESAMDDLSKTIKVVTPRTSRDSIVRSGV